MIGSHEQQRFHELAPYGSLNVTKPEYFWELHFDDVILQEV